MVGWMGTMDGESGERERVNGAGEWTYARVSDNGYGQYEPDSWWSILGIVGMSMSRKGMEMIMTCGGHAKMGIYMDIERERWR